MSHDVTNKYILTLNIRFSADLHFGVNYKE